MAANATDERLFFSQKPERTLRLGVDTTSRALDGPLKPGKYLCRVLGIGGNTMWVTIGDHDAGLVATLGAAPAAGAVIREDQFPLDANLASFTLHVRRGAENNGLAAILDAGTAQLVLTKAS